MVSEVVVSSNLRPSVNKSSWSPGGWGHTVRYSAGVRGKQADGGCVRQGLSSFNFNFFFLIFETERDRERERLSSRFHAQCTA